MENPFPRRGNWACSCRLALRNEFKYRLTHALGAQHGGQAAGPVATAGSASS